MTTLALSASAGARPPSLAAPRTSWRWRWCGLTVASGAVVFTEPAPFDVLTVGLVVLLPAIGLVAMSPALVGLLALMLVAAAAGVRGRDGCRRARPRP